MVNKTSNRSTKVKNACKRQRKLSNEDVEDTARAKSKWFRLFEDGNVGRKHVVDGMMFEHSFHQRNPFAINLVYQKAAVLEDQVKKATAETII